MPMQFLDVKTDFAFKKVFGLLGYEVGTPEAPDLASDLWNNAHTATLEEYGLTDVDLYHPETIR